MLPSVFELASIGISRTERHRKNGIQVEYRPFVLIQSQNGELIELLHTMFPEADIWSDERGETTIWIFEVKGKSRVKHLLELILPHIWTQRDRWEALWEYVNTFRPPPEVAEEYRRIINRRNFD